MVRRLSMMRIVRAKWQWHLLTILMVQVWWVLWLFRKAVLGLYTYFGDNFHVVELDGLTLYQVNKISWESSTKLDFMHNVVVTPCTSHVQGPSLISGRNIPLFFLPIQPAHSFVKYSATVVHGFCHQISRGLQTTCPCTFGLKYHNNMCPAWPILKEVLRRVS